MNRHHAQCSYGQTWRRFDAIEQRLSTPLTERMLELAGLKPGMHVLDIATGRGEPAIPAAQRVHPDGMVLGIDIDRSVLQIASERATQEGVTNLTLVVSDAEDAGAVPDAAFDVALSRWGLMYFSDPLRTLHRIRQSLVKDGVFVVAVWTDPDRASFDTLPKTFLSTQEASTSTASDEPGPFYYADIERLASHLACAGFRMEHSEVFDVDVMEAKSDTLLLDWCRSVGASRLLQGTSADAQRTWERQVLSAAEQYRCDDGFIRLGGRSRIVAATRIQRI